MFYTKRKDTTTTTTQTRPPLDAKKLTHHLTLSRDIDDQRIMQCDWRRGTTGHTQLKVVVSNSTFL